MRKHMRDPYEVNLMDELTLKGITQYYAFVQGPNSIEKNLLEFWLEKNGFHLDSVTCLNYHF